jgi:hypothetical protein
MVCGPAFQSVNIKEQQLSVIRKIPGNEIAETEIDLAFRVRLHLKRT